MSECNGCQMPEDLYYDLDYIWARPEEDGAFTIGITDPAQTMSDRHVGTLESGQWAGGVPVPFAGGCGGAQRGAACLDQSL
jgi:glycine cleavage system H protein